MTIFKSAADLEHSRESAALCIVVFVSGSTPRKPGAKMIVVDTGTSHGETIGSIGGGAIEHLIRRQAIQCIRQRQPKLVETSLKAELGMCCGGLMQVFIEPIAKKPHLICFGAGHINQALCPLAISLGFN